MACEAQMEIPAALMEGDPRFIIVGETHGTDTSPEAFGDIVCAQLQSRPVLVQFEFPAAWGEYIDGYVTTGDEASLQKLFGTPLFNGARYDGRASKSFVALLRRLRQAAKSGLPVRVAGFQPDWWAIEPQHYYELGMAHGLTMNAAAHRDALNIALVGGYHARRMTPQNKGKSAASYLLDSDFISLSPCPEGGTASNLGKQGSRVRELEDLNLKTPRGVYTRDHFEFSKMAENKMFDGFYCSGRPAKASPRAIPAQPE